MSKTSPQTSSRNVVLDAAEQLFAVRGYTAVTLKDIAKKLGIKQASLYYHAPGGKEELYFEVMLRHLEHRRVILEKLISESEPTLEDTLFRIGMWLINQPPLNPGRMILTDLPELSDQKAAQLEETIGRCFFNPIQDLFVRYQHQLNGDPSFIGGTFISSTEALYAFKRYGVKTDEELIADLINLLLMGVLKS